MRRYLVIGIILAVMFGTFAVAAQPVRALPEYAAQVGEPCATCHVSAAGGGPRGPRGQAWVALDRPGVAPDLADALDTLGVTLTADPSFYTDVVDEWPETELLVADAEEARTVLDWLLDYDGN